VNGVDAGGKVVGVQLFLKEFEGVYILHQDFNDIA
jgi:hypothetical protein